MNWLDLLIFLGVLWGAWNGWRRGFADEFCHTGAAVAALVLAVRFTTPLSDAVAMRLSVSPGLARVGVFLALLVGVAAVGYSVTPYVRRLTHALRPGFDRWAGSTLGGAKALLIATMLVVVCARLPWATAQSAVSGSAVAIQMLQMAPALYEAVRTMIPETTALF